MKRIFTLVLLSFCFVHLGFTQNSNVIDPELYALMNSRSGDKISVNIILKENVDASSLNVRKAFHNKDAKRTYMVNELKTQAEKNQADVVKTLQASERSSQVTDINCHWLTNMINCKASADAILKIAEHPDVEAVIYNKKEYMLFDEKKESGAPTRAYNGTNVEKINAHKVWELGFTGDGIIVAVLDTGVNTDHVDLKDHLWDDGNGHHGVNTLVGDSYFPQYTDRYDVSDAEGHGTHCAGTVCGDGTSGTITGMAPDAKLMCVKVLGDEGEGTLETILAGVEYAVENGADVLSMSLGISGPTDLVNEVVREAFENMLPLDVVAAVAAGNDGDEQGKYPIPYNINAPASCPPPYLSPDQTEIGGKTNVICVGAVNYSDQSCGFSSEGPVTWQNTAYGDYKLGKVYATTTLKYDNGTYSKSYSYNEASDCFGVMFPSSKLSGFADGSVLASVSIYDAVSDAGIIEIFSGGNTPSEGTKIHSQLYQINGTKSMVDINILTDVNIDKTKNLWVIFTSYTSGTPVPVTTKNNQADANGCWLYKNGTWSNTGITKASIMVRANISTGAAIEEHIGLIRPDVCAPGYNIQSASNTDNEWYDWLSGTSMATPCVAGAIALLLDANPSLTPAQICEALETTAVKLSETKSNKTGTGRIDIYNALLSVVDLPLSAPTLTATAQSTSVINLSWSTVAEATSYNVYRGLSKIASVATGTTYSDTGLNPGTEYCYTVTSVNSAVESTKMNEACARTLSAVTVPGAFTLTATPQSTSSIALSWTESSGATSYDVYRAVQKVATGLTTTSYTDNGLSASTQYCYSIVAVNTAGQTESNQACATTQSSGSGGADGEVEIGEQESSTGMLPIASAYPTGFTQQIYTSDEINETNDMTGGMVTYIAFTQSNTISGTRNIEVYMQNTTKSSFTGSSNSKDWVAMPETYKVFEGNVTLPGQNKDLEIKLDIPFAYTGDNILISVWDKTDGYTNSNAQFYRYGTNYNRSIRIANWGATYNPANMGSVYGYLDGYNNVIKITFEAAETIIPVPQNVKATPANIFVDQSTTISWDACAGASSYNIYVDGVNRGSSNSTSYVLSNLQYNMTPGAKVTVTAIVDGEESEPSKDVIVKVGGYFPLVINVVDHLGNPMQGVTIDLDGYDEIGNAISQTYTSDANGSVSVAKMPLPLLNNCYNIEAVKSIYTGYATICDYDNAYGDIIKDVEHVVTIVMELPSPMALYADKDTYAVGENIILTWDKVTSASPQGYNLYEKYWDDGSSSFVYEKINATLIPANTNTYTVVGGLPTRGCDNTICLTAVYTESETSKGNPSVTVAKTGNGTMAGIVVDENGNPISDVSVTVQGTSCDGSGSYEYTYTTGANGKFGENMPMGIYNVFASKPGSIYNDRSAFDIEVVHGEETEVIIEMWEKGYEYEIEREIGENPAPYIDYLGPVLPVSTGYLYSASQQIYLKEELNFASASDVKITSVSFRVYGNTNVGKQDTIRIFVQNTTKAEFATLKDWANVYDDDPGFMGSYTIPSDGEWITFNFNKPLEYTGGNLLVAAHRHAPALQQSGFYVCETETRRSLCGADDYFNPVNKQTDATALYKINTIKVTYTTTSPEVVVNPNPIDFGEVIVGDYWREKPDATVPVQVKGYNTKIDAVTVDNPFFTMPALNLPQNIVDFDMGYNKNNAPGYKAGVLTATPQKGLVEEVKVTATAYDPVEPDVFEKSREVVWVNDEYEDTPAITTLHDDYILPGETEEGTKKDAVYKFTLEADAYVTAKIYNGNVANLAFYKYDFANDDVDKDGPSYDNAYYGTGGAPVEPIDICILGDDCDGTLPGWTFLNKSDNDKGFGWFVSDGSGTMSGWHGKDGANDWALGSRKYWYGHGVGGVLSPENYVYTTDKYEITAMSQISFEHRHSDGFGNYWKDMFDVVISEDGTNFTSVEQIKYTEYLGSNNWLTATVSLSEYAGETVHIGFMHKDDSAEDDGDGVKIDNVCISGVLKTDGSRSGNKPSVRASGSVTAMMEDLLFPKGTYYVVPAAETEFTFTLSKRNVEEGIIFTGTGDWKTATNWNINAVPQPTDDVIIRGDAVVNDNVEINSIFIENDATLTIASTGVLEVTEGITNKIHSAFVIEDGGQLYQNAADVAATFNMNINNPATWGPDGSNHTQGWQFIASPFLDADMLNYVVTDDGDYDLYKYDGTQELEWVNYKLHHDEFSHDFADGMQGWTVLDANSDGFSWSYNNGAGNDGAAGYLSCVLRQGKTNDYLVSPKLINTYPESKLRFWIKNASDITTTNEVEVWLSADKAAAPTSENDFVTKVATVEVTNAWQQVELLLEAYADQDDRDFMEYWIAIRSTSSASNNTEVLIDKLELANYDEPNPYETEFVLGRGYMASYEKDGTASLQGTLNYENTFNYKVAFSDAKRWENFYLIGNPFTYNINWTNFTHSNIVNGFAVVDNDGSYVYDVNAEIKVGDGIMIQTTGANPTISVAKDTRNEVADYINVVASGSEGDDNFIVSLSGDEYEGFKKLENFNENISQVYVSEYGTHYGIVNRDADVEEIEFCFDVKKMGYYTISVTPNGDFSSVILYDRVEDVETEMLTGGGYRFMAQNANDNYDRFVLKLAKKPADEDIFVYQSGDELIVNAEGLVQIIDVMGRIIYSGNQNGVNRINVSGMENSACMIRNINNNEVRTQKIVIL